MNQPLWEHAERSLRARDIGAAVEGYRRLLDTEFATPAALRLSLIASQAGQFRDSVNLALRAFSTRVADADLLDMLCKQLFMAGELRASIQCAQEILAIADASPQACVETARIMSDATMPALALRLLDAARARGLDSAGMRYLRGNCLMYLGQLQQAEAELEAAISRDPLLAHAHWALSKLQRHTPQFNHVDRLRGAIASTRGRDQDQALLHYALFKELDEIGDAAAAAEALGAGMKARRRMIRHDAAAEHALFLSLMETPPAVTADEASAGPIPIFIVGLPRSGTTLLETMLGHHPEVAACGELNDATMQLRWMCNQGGGPHADAALMRGARDIDPARYGERYLQHTRWRAEGRRFFTDKMPENFLNLGILARALPQARFIHIHRDPMDACFSNLKELFAAAYSYSYDLIETADHYHRYEQLMAHWHRVFPERVLNVRYEDLVAHPEAVMREVVRFNGLGWHASVLETGNDVGAIATASTAQVREPVHQRFVAQWRRYEHFLAPMERRLGELGVLRHRAELS